MTETQKLREALNVAAEHLDMGAFELSYPKEADLIRAALSLPTQAEPVEGGEVRTFRAALMGHGRVAISQCKDQNNGTPGIVYLDMGGEQRTIDADTSDLFEPGSVADESKVLACIYFATPDAVRQSIAVLHELLADQFGDTTPPASQEQA